MNAPRAISDERLSRALGLTPSPAWPPTGVILDALVALKIRLDGDRITTSWRLATVWSRRWEWPTRYHEAAARGLALALASGDDAAAARAAMWFVDESAAMDAALARLAGEVRS